MSETYQQLLVHLIEITKNWGAIGIPSKEEKKQCRDIGEKLNSLGGIKLMREAYYETKSKNRYASVVEAYWHGIGDWLF